MYMWVYFWTFYSVPCKIYLSHEGGEKARLQYSVIPFMKKSTFPLGKEIEFGEGLRSKYLKRNVHFHGEEHSFVTLDLNASDYDNITSFAFLTQAYCFCI